jgi:glutamine amidotransferase
MARLVGFIGNRPDLGSRVIELEGRALSVRRKPGVLPGWGVGFYQGGEILLRRRPLDDRTEIGLADVTKDVKADILVAHVRAATVGALRTENTHPFRYRHWLFAHTGTIESFEALRGRLSDSLPQFLHRDVRGDTDSELLFHLFLSFLHDSGQLDRPAVEPAEARSALRSSIALVDRLCAEEGQGPVRMNILVSSPEHLIAVHDGTKMAYRHLRGRQDFERVFSDGGLGRMRLHDLGSCRFTIVASDFDNDELPAGWTPVPERSFVTMNRIDEPVFEPL